MYDPDVNFPNDEPPEIPGSIAAIILLIMAVIDGIDIKYLFGGGIIAGFIFGLLVFL